MSRAAFSRVRTRFDRTGAQEPECTRAVHEDSEHRASPDQGRAVVFQQPVRALGPAKRLGYHVLKSTLLAN